jgi:hypothetical protein
MQQYRVRMVRMVGQPGLQRMDRRIGGRAQVAIGQQMPHQATVIELLCLAGCGQQVAPGLGLEGAAHACGIGRAHHSCGLCNALRRACRMGDRFGGLLGRGATTPGEGCCQGHATQRCAGA